MFYTLCIIIISFYVCHDVTVALVVFLCVSWPRSSALCVCVCVFYVYVA